MEGQKARQRVWRKLHLAVDPVTHDIVAAEVSLENVHDAEVLPTLLNPLRRKLGHVYADGAYDSKASHQLISRKGATACIPPRKSAGLWKKGHPRNEAVLVMRKKGLAHWKKISGYHRRSLAETAMYRLKQLLAGKISLRNYKRPSGRSHGVCQRHKPAEYLGSACQKASSVAVTRSWGSHDLLADLGNLATVHTI